MFSIPDKDNPCKRDCPKRTATCHATCPEYKKYAAKKKREREARQAIKEQENMVRIARRDSWLKGRKEKGLK